MAGKVRLLGEAAQKAIILTKENEGFYGANSVDANGWHDLAEYSVYDEADFVEYTAQKVSVSEALECVEHALLIADKGDYGLDAVVQDLEDCLDSLGEVTGSVTPDDILGSIFSHFCVGK